MIFKNFCDMSSARTDILGRYPKFFLSLRESTCYEVRVLANLTATDLRTTTGRNLRAVKIMLRSWKKVQIVQSSRKADIHDQ